MTNIPTGTLPRQPIATCHPWCARPCKICSDRATHKTFSAGYAGLAISDLICCPWQSERCDFPAEVRA